MSEQNLQVKSEQILTRPLPSSANAAALIRSCSFYTFKAAYEDFPDDSICYLGIAACADCLESDTTNEFREMTKGTSLK